MDKIFGGSVSRRDSGRRTLRKSADAPQATFQCRFIAVTDRFDTKFQQADISIQIKNLANEMYAKDISRKICSSMRTIQEQGKFAGSRAPYGYCLDPKDKHHLVVDEETAPVVKRMFEMVADGNTLHYVATTLNSEGIPSPGRLLYDRGIASTDHFKNSKWYMQTIKRILTEEVYLGWMISGKFRSTYHSTGQKGSRPAPKEEWIVTKGTHEPIVTKELFDQVQLYFQRLKEELGQAAVYDSKSKRASIFKGHLRCGECGQAMFLRNKKERQTAIDSMRDELAATEATITKLRVGKEKAAVLEADAKGIQLLNGYRPKELRKLIEKVRVYENGRIEIDFRCHDDFTEEIIKAVARRAG